MVVPGPGESLSPSDCELPARFKPIGPASSDGDCVVLEAHDELMDKDVLLRVAPLSSEFGRVTHNPLLREYKLLSYLQHPSLPDVVDVGVGVGRCWMALGGLAGLRPLPTWSDGEWSAELFSLWLDWVLLTVDYLHGRGVVHGSLSPGTVVAPLDCCRDRCPRFMLAGLQRFSWGLRAAHGGWGGGGHPVAADQPPTAGPLADLRSIGILAAHVLSDGVGQGELGDGEIRWGLLGCTRGVSERVIAVLRRMTDAASSAGPSSAAEARAWLRDGEMGAGVAVRRGADSGTVQRRRIVRQLQSAMRHVLAGGDCLLVLAGPEGMGKTKAGRIAEVEARCAGWEFASHSPTQLDDLRAGLGRRGVALGEACERVGDVGGSGKPVLHFVDDVDGVEGAELLSSVAALRQATGGDCGVLLIATCKSVPSGLSQIEEAGSSISSGVPASGGASVLVRRVGALTRSETAELIADILRRTPGESLTERVRQYGEGYPVLVRELIGLLATKGLLEESARGVELAPGVEELPVPETAGLLLDECMNELSPKQRELAVVIALGPGVTPHVLSHVTGLAVSEVQSVLRELTDREILASRSSDGAQVFSSDALRERVYKTTSTADLQKLHDSVVEALRAPSDRPHRSQPADEVLGWHLFRGRNPHDAAKSVLRAAASRAADGDLDGSTRYIEMLMDIPIDAVRGISGCSGTLAEIAQDCWRLGRAATCVQVCELGIAVSDPSGALAGPAAQEFSTLLARAHVLNGDMAEAENVLTAVLSNCKETDDSAALTKSYYGLCMVYQMSGRLREMEKLAVECLAVAERSGIQDLVRLACCARGNALVALSRWREALESYLDEVEILHRLGDKRGLATAFGNIGRIHMHLGEWSSAEVHVERALLLAREIGSDYLSGLNLGNRAALLARRGSLSAAADCLGEGLLHIELAGDVWSRAALLSDLGELEILRGNLSAAEEHLSRSKSLMERTGAVDDLPELHRRKAESLHALGQTVEAETLAVEAQHAAEEMGNRLEAANGLRVLGEIASAKGSHAEGIRVLNDALQRLRDLGAPYELNQTLDVMGRVLLRDGAEADGIEALHQALEGFTRLGARRDARKAQEELASAEGRVGPGPGQLPDEKERLAALYASTHSLSSAQSVRVMIQDLADAAAATVPADGVAVVVLPTCDDPLVVRSSLCDLPESDSKVLSLVSPALAELEKCEGEVLVLSPDTASQSHLPMLNSGGIERLALVPMLSGERLVGVLSLDHRAKSREFSDEDKRFLRALAVQAATLIENVQLRSKLTEEVETLRWVVDGRHKFSNIVGQSLRMQQLFSTLERVARTPVTVLIEGESGTGKELVARAVHLNGPRKDERFVAQNCAALPEQLLESELFGHMRGAFTGAHRDKQGLFEVADGGTFFLDEIADMPPSLQVKLLRVLQDGEIRRVGSTDSIDVDVRIIAATNKRLRDEVASGRFREDLFYRLNVVRVEMPPLRDRRDDIPLLAQHFLNRATEAAGEPERGFSDRAMDLLVNYDWPGNVRELENEIERAVALSDLGSALTSESLSDRIRSVHVAIHPPKPGTRLSLKNMVEDVEKRVILQVLNENRWNKSRTAEALGLSRQGLLKKIARFGLTRDEE